MKSNYFLFVTLLTIALRSHRISVIDNEVKLFFIFICDLTIALMPHRISVIDNEVKLFFICDSFNYCFEIAQNISNRQLNQVFFKIVLSL
jgi:hypothetical protein